MTKHQIYFKGVLVSKTAGSNARMLQALIDANGTPLSASELKDVTGAKYTSTHINALRTRAYVRIKSEGTGKNVVYWLPDGYKLEEV